MGSNNNPRNHIERIRKEKYWIGTCSNNPVSKDLRMAVKYLSAELYSKDVHFLMELIQNAEDNEYEEGVKPTLEFLVTCRDITRTGAPATLLIFNNEKGFSTSNIDSICSVGNSTKVGQRKKGYIGEKGIGFKSVFLLTSQPYIFSNGYQIRFSDNPCPECDIAYIVPEWVEENPTVSDIEQIYGGSIPTTAIILPLKPDKVQSVKGQLSNLHPEMLLFLSKIRRLTVKEDDGKNSGLNPLQSVSISSEKDFVRKSSMDAESFTLHLAIDEDISTDKGRETDCSYYMWRQRFPVKNENRVERRAEVDEWTITLAFPWGERLCRGMTCAGIYAFLPTEMVTNLPFIIQADFLLQSSREAILMDDVWNQGILDCVPIAFVNAFTSLVKTVEGAPSSSLASMFSFLPVKESPFSKLNAVRESIKKKILLENIIPSEDINSNQRFFYKPSEVARLAASFWSILYNAKKQGIKLHSLSSHGRYILSSSFDKEEYDDILKFLSVGFVDNDWYSKCLRSSDMVLGVDEETYFDLLKFVARNWSRFQDTTMIEVPLLKHIGADGKLSLFSVDDLKVPRGPKLCRSADSRSSAWLIRCSREFNSAANMFFLPQETQKILYRSELVENWLNDALGMKTLTVCEYAKLLSSLVRFNGKLALAFAHFMYHSSYAKKGFLSHTEMKSLCGVMPLVDSYGSCVSNTRDTILVPANGSKWIELLGSNPWTSHGYVELWEKYTASGTFCGETTRAGQLVCFFKQYDIAFDIPDISPPNSALPSINAPLIKKNVFLLLDWLLKLNSRRITVPTYFLQSIKEGSWCRVLISGSASYQPPSQSFLSSLLWDSLLQKCCVNIDIPVIDEKYYDNKISNYKNELKFIGVRSECEDVCEFIGKHITSHANELSFSKKQLLAILILVQYLRQKSMSPDKLISSAQEGRLRTSQGDKSPEDCVLYDEGWKAASLVSNIAFIDKLYYGEEILNYKTELQLLGVETSTNNQYQIAVDHLKHSPSLVNLCPEAFIFLLKCLQHGVSSSSKVIDSLKAAKCLRTTNKGYVSPVGCFLPDAEMGFFLKMFDCFPIIEHPFYGHSILYYRAELEKLGVFITNADATREFLTVFKQKVSSLALNQNHILSFLACFRNLTVSDSILWGDHIINELRQVKWVRTRLGDYRCPAGCILFGNDWESVYRFTMLPFVDDSDSGYGAGIHHFKAELMRLGVVTDIEKNHHFVIEHLSLKREVGPTDMLSLLECIRKVLPAEGHNNFPCSFTSEISKKWVKTRFGYRSPEESILFSGSVEWAELLQCSDGPFIDEEYYGHSISSYGKELEAVGVIVQLEHGASLLAKHLKLLSDSDSIKRVYHYLDHVNWEPEEGTSAAASHVIWVPGKDSGGVNADGSWVSASECVLHDEDGMFGSRLIVLEDRGFDKELLSFFRRAFRVKSNPSLDDYCQLWKEWEREDHTPSHAQCCSFWACIVKHWHLKTEKALSQNLTKVPCLSMDVAGEIVLVEKSKVFIPDDLLLKDLFSQSTRLSLFVWSPRPSHPTISHSKLLEIYKSIGVKTVSESAVKVESSILNEDATIRHTKLDNVFLRRGMFMLVLGFLSSDELGLDHDRRMEIMKVLTQVTVYETEEPITVGYSLPVPATSEENVDVKASRMVMVRWEKERAEFFAQKLDKSAVGPKEILEYAKNFSQVVSQGLLWKMEEHIPRLEKLLTVGFCVDFDDEAVAYYMKAENLQVFMEDGEFIESVILSSSTSSS